MQPQNFSAAPSPMQPAPVKKKQNVLSVVTWCIVAVSIVALLAGVAWAVIYFMGYTSSDNGKTQAGVAAVLEPESTAPLKYEIDSQLGITVPYDARELEAYGFADETTYSSTDLEEARAYTVIRVRPLSTSEATRSTIAVAPPELRMTSSLNENYWEVLSKKDGYDELSKLDMLVKETVDVRTVDSMTVASDTEVREVGEVSYRKVTFTSTDERYGVKTERKEECYMTVQYDRPYVACINNIRASNFAATSQLEVVLAATRYSAPQDNVLISSNSGEQDEAMVDDANDEKIEVTDGGEEVEEKAGTVATSTVPSYLANSEDFKALATAAPATVRVGTVYCADIRLALPNGGDGATLTGACVDKAGTGFFISRDGIVATSASATRVKPQEAIVSYITNAPNSSQVVIRLERVLNYLVESRVIMQTDADALLAGVEERDQDSIAKVNALGSRIDPENISITKEEYSYAVQLADRPIVVANTGGGSGSFTYTDSVVEAEFEAAAYSTTVTQEQIYKSEAASPDVALLKVKKQAAYPVLTLGRSGEGLAEGTPVNIVGRPMYAVGSLEFAQFRATPMYRTAKVSETFSPNDGQRLRAISTPSHAGFAGAPVVNRTYSVVGMAAFNNLNCPDQECFAGAVIRDTSGLSELLQKRNIRLTSTSISSEVWQRGLNELVRGNYKNATALFKESAQLYPQNYLASKFAEYSEAQYGTASDTSTINIVVRVLQTVLIIAGVVLVLLAIVRVGLRLFVRPHVETQYGQMNTDSYIDPAQWQQRTPQTMAPQSPTIPQPSAWQQPSQPPVQTQAPPAAPYPYDSQQQQAPQTQAPQQTWPPER